jgi:spore maturation protein CgeB
VPAVFGWQASHSQRFTGKLNFWGLSSALSHRTPRLHPDYQFRNRRLLETVKRCEPDVILLHAGNHVIFPETLRTIKSTFNCKLIYLSGVSPIVFSNPIERQAAPLYDLVAVNDFYHGIQWLELGAKRMEVLPLSACDPQVHHPYALTKDEEAKYQCEIGFVGTLLPRSLYGNRAEALEALSGYNLGLWSIHAVPASLERFYRGPALGEQMLRAICGSLIQINPHGNFMRYGGNMRLFEAAGCGVFQITDDLPGISKWFTVDENIAVYSDLNRLQQHVAYYLAHDEARMQIAAAARKHAYSKHTYDQRMMTLISLLH